GYPDDHPLVAGQLKELEALTIEEPDRFHVQPCVSPVWDTCLALNALLASGLSPAHPALGRAADWLLARQIAEPGDWAVSRPKLVPGGWHSSSPTTSTPTSTTPRSSRWGWPPSTIPTVPACATRSSARPAGSSACRAATGAGPRSTSTRRACSSTTSPSPTTGRCSTRPPRT